jgi:glycosyltransferase involved in cell wall biosynthesis
MSLPLLSIITPVYNAKTFIAGCIDSVATQVSPSIEHIIVDGGSTDGTLDVIRAKARDYPHIRFISEPDRGQSDAMNKGLRMARAEYVGFLNADDFYEAGVLRPILDLLGELREPRFIVGACNVLGDGDRLWGVNRPRVLKLAYMLADDQKWPFPWNPSSYFYPKFLHDVVGYYQIDEHLVMDGKFFFAAIQKVKPLYVDRVIGNFRAIDGTKTSNAQSDGSFWAVKHRMLSDVFRNAPLGTKMLTLILKFYRTLVRRSWPLRDHISKVRNRSSANTVQSIR